MSETLVSMQCMTKFTHLRYIRYKCRIKLIGDTCIVPVSNNFLGYITIITFGPPLQKQTQTRNVYLKRPNM